MRQVLVVALVLLAGCSGVFDAPTASDSPSVTPAPVPTPSPAATVVLPQTADGSPAVGRIIAAHRTALATTDFRRRTVLDETLSATDVWVDHDADRAWVRRVTGERVDIVIADGRRYERANNGSVRNESAATGLPYVQSASGFFLFQQYVSGLVYNRTETVTRNGTTLAVLRANTTDSTISRAGFRTVVAADSTLYVDRDGVIREFDHRERYADGTVRTVHVRVWTGENSVTMPTWFDERARATDG